MHIRVAHLSLNRFPMWHACHSAGNKKGSSAWRMRWNRSHLSFTATYFSCGELPIAGLSWLGFCGGWGFCCRGGRPPGPPWPWAAGRGCWVVGAPGRPCWPGALCCCVPPCDCCLGGMAGLCCGGGFWPADGFCCDTDCCLWAWGDPPWLRWGEPWPDVGLWPWVAGPWLALVWLLGSPVAGLAADCWVCTGGWPWGCGRCWDGGLCWGPPIGDKQKKETNHIQILKYFSTLKVQFLPCGEGRCWDCGTLGCETGWGETAFYKLTRGKYQYKAKMTFIRWLSRENDNV